MTDTPRPDPASLPQLPVHWFGASRRQVGGVPDSHYGWLDTPAGPCIVKTMDPALTVYNKTLLAHERKILARLQALGAPVPALVDLGRPDWLATRFAGLSLERLAHAFSPDGADPRLVFPLAERLAVWVQLLRRLQPLADRGVWVIDLYEANIVVPLTEGVQGQLRLQEPMLIDHAHTLEPGMGLSRPVWLNLDMARIPPELRQALQQDQDALREHFRAARAPLPSHSRLPTDTDPRSRRLWAEYKAPQALQHLLDANQLSADHAMQFAAATAMQGLLQAFAGMPCRAALQAVLARMTSEQPVQRYPSLSDAAAALAALLQPLPLASRHHYGPLRPEDLQTPSQVSASALAFSTAPAAALGADHTRPAAELHGLPARTAQPGVHTTQGAAHRGSVPWPWGWVAGALGLVLGLLSPLPW